MEGRCLKMVTEDQNQTLQCWEKRYLVFSSVFIAVLAVATMTVVFVVFHMLSGEVPGKSAAFENAITVLQMATPVLIVNAVLAYIITSRSPVHASEKSALVVIENEIDAIKNMLADITLKVTRTSPSKREASEELLHKLQLLPSQLDEIMSFALKTKEKAEFVTQKIESDKEQKISRNTGESCPGTSNKTASEEDLKISSIAAYNSTKQKIDILAEVIKEKFNSLSRVSHLEKCDTQEFREELRSLVDALIEKSSFGSESSAKTTPESCGASDKETEPHEFIGKEQLHLTEAKIEVSGLEKATSETGCSERTEGKMDEACCSEKTE